MTYDKFKYELNLMDFSITFIGDYWSVGRNGIANTLLIFNPQLPAEDYVGEVTIKSYNAWLYQADEIKLALQLVDELLCTPLDERGVYINPFKDVK